jgi:23S rRNA G2069 N7-methylase RlmK/C1962 C5-methylase RlmI
MERDKIEYQTEIFQNRLAKRYKHLRKWARRCRIEAYRLYDRDIPEIPLTVDIYGSAIAGALYERPYTKEPEEETLWLSAMSRCIAECLDIPEERIFIKQRKRLKQRQSTAVQYTRIADQKVIETIHEGGLVFQVNVSDYLDTGLFLDHRITRSLVREQSAGKSVLNLFCYTGAFSVYAADGQARYVDSVDLSNTYLDRAIDNFSLNHFTAQRISPNQFFTEHSAYNYRFIRADALEFLQYAQKRKCHWDLIILDPPTFSNSKKMTRTLDIKRDHGELISRCLSLLTPYGTLWFSTNAHGFKLDENSLRAQFPSLIIKDMKQATTDEDFRNKPHHACYTLSV